MLATIAVMTINEIEPDAAATTLNETWGDSSDERRPSRTSAGLSK
jgi:hypothetical protein